MDNIVECVMAGGPEHGLVLYLQADPLHPGLPTAMASDGRICRAAARSNSLTCSARYVLLHPNATGRDLADAMAATLDVPRHREPRRHAEALAA